jgi:hypothetical protein
MFSSNLVKKMRILWAKMYRMTRLALLRMARLVLLLILVTVALVYLFSSRAVSHTDIIIQNSLHIDALPGRLVNSDILVIDRSDQGERLIEGPALETVAEVGPWNICSIKGIVSLYVFWCHSIDLTFLHIRSGFFCF